MLVVTRFRVPETDVASFRAAVEEARAALAGQPGYVESHVGRNVDDPALWVLQTRWENVGAYRRALSAYEVKVRAWGLLGRALDEPGAYELVGPDDEPSRPVPREG